MLYQLPSGKVIEMSTEQYLEMSDEELEYLIGFNYGEVLENPWFGSAISKKNMSSNNFNSDDTPEISDLTNTPEELKLDSLDVDYTEED
jgi:hypothetical protein